MKAILVKYHGPGNVRGSRFKASAEGVASIYRSYNHALNGDENAEYVAKELANLHGWLADGSRLVGGELPNGDRCFVFVNS